MLGKSGYVVVFISDLENYYSDANQIKEGGRYKNLVQGVFGKVEFGSRRCVRGRFVLFAREWNRRKETMDCISSVLLNMHGQQAKELRRLHFSSIVNAQPLWTMWMPSTGEFVCERVQMTRWKIL